MGGGMMGCVWTWAVHTFDVDTQATLGGSGGEKSEEEGGWVGMKFGLFSSLALVHSSFFSLLSWFLSSFLRPSANISFSQHSMEAFAVEQPSVPPVRARLANGWHGSAMEGVGLAVTEGLVGSQAAMSNGMGVFQWGDRRRGLRYVAFRGVVRYIAAGKGRSKHDSETEKAGGFCAGKRARFSKAGV